jgi:hypothetical protein
MFWKFKNVEELPGTKQNNKGYMNTRTNRSLEVMKEEDILSEMKIQNENPPEKAPMGLDDILSPDNNAGEGDPIEKSTQRALELSRKGIFACPKFTRLFNDDEDDARIC